MPLYSVSCSFNYWYFRSVCVHAHLCVCVCSDINECFVNNGDCMGDCVNTAGSFLCVCSQGHRQLENGSCVLVTTLPTSSTLTTHTTATTTKEGLTLLVLLLLIPLMAVLLLLVMSVAAVTTCKRKRLFTYSSMYGENTVTDTCTRLSKHMLK